VLKKDSRPVSISPKALDLLVVLVQRHGHIVEKEELIREVWHGAFVEDGNIAFNISVLRKLFAESSALPQYIETVPKRGYRFVADVRTMPAAQPPAEKQIPPEKDKGNDRVEIQESGAGPIRRARAGLVGAGITLLALTALVGVWSTVRRIPRLSEGDTIVLAEFANRTGDSAFDGTLDQGLAAQIGHSPFLSIVSESRVHQTLRLMNEPANTALTPQIAREICLRTGSTALLEGSIGKLGSDYVITLLARNCSSGDVLDHQQVQVAHKEDVLNALNRMARIFRAHAGESINKRHTDDPALAEATTPSIEALKAYSAAWKVLASSGSAAAIPLFRRAVEIDPAFAIAHAYLGRAYADIGDASLSAESTRRAYQLRNRATERELFFISVSYNLQVTGNLRQAEKLCHAWAQGYPRDKNPDTNPHGFLAGMIYPVLGKYESALEESRKMLELDPDFAISYNVLALNYQSLNRFREAEQVVRQAEKRRLRLPDLLVDRFQLAFLKRDQIDKDRVVALSREQGETEDLMANVEAFSLAYTGHLREARKKFELEKDLAHKSSKPGRLALIDVEAALWEAFLGNRARAESSASEALANSTDRDVEYGAGFAFALVGDLAKAQYLAKDLETRFPEDTAVQLNYVPTVAALIALKKRKPERALQLLEVARPYELGTPPCSFFGLFGALYPVYVEGEAQLAVGRGTDAATTFERILDHSGIVASDPIGVLSRLQLAKAFALTGDKVDAQNVYTAFFRDWKDGDPDIPILKQAKAEYTQLASR
ncbi:MAG: winged helix-turn-helix domain-containing protein, partial [Acidobacteriaceae bacterium]|nr:winged helix-turn-helix domain-containing protein [Acidobacteriaceae bacterium]